MPDQETSFEDNSKGLNATEKMVRGSLWMTIGNVLSRLLGAIYIIPWYAWMGEQGNVANSLFNKGYNVYALFLMIATAGIPGAIAKQIAFYNSQNEYKTSQRLFKRTLVIMAGFGVLCAGIMYLISPILAAGDEKLIPVMRALSVAVLVFPSMSVIRGYFQGNQDMMPSAVSQIVEQIARVFYMLLATFIIIKVMQGSYVTAVIHSTFAAFIGMLGAYGALIWFYKKQKPEMDRLIAGSNNEIVVSENHLVKEMLIEAIPFIIVGSAITFFKLIDQFTFERIMSGFTNFSKDQLSALFSIFSANPDKLVMITISLATGMAMTSLPLITESYTKKDEAGLAKLVSDNIQLLFFIMMPATFGMIVLAKPMYVLFYQPDALGISVLIEASYIGLIMGYFILISTTLQGLYKNGDAIFNLGVGLLIKLILQYPMIRGFEVYGPLIASGIGFSVSAYLMTRKVHDISKFNYSLTLRRTILILILSLLMSGVTTLTRSFLYLFLNPERKFQAFIIILISVAVGIAFYGWLALKTRLADKLMGDKVAKVRTKLKIK
ncbi:putative polysaccharide biosynthesis protein [Vagococcus carniphilus]|uniref:Polysaccharide biosynthesis protein n=1 Tax=Vagococcus carniphilus TaxID=218144 RepID=A0A430AVC6_9ENTE|nr:polysaccharide biosynthesis protein [Vagococcus carniphilus]QNN73117.1 polysaccharide biosynthesis protein [Vagococcus carniphilus]RSU12007.1 polysaccharide biosynthesis protein [Vagococcus carniphilus]